MGITQTDKIITDKDSCPEEYKVKFNKQCHGACGIIITKYTNWKDDWEDILILHARNCPIGNVEYEKGLSEWQKNNGFEMISKPNCDCGGEKANTTHARYCSIYKEYK